MSRRKKRIIVEEEEEDENENFDEDESIVETTMDPGDDSSLISEEKEDQRLFSDEEEFLNEWEADVEVKQKNKKTTARQKGSKMEFSHNALDDFLESTAPQNKRKKKVTEEEMELERQEKARRRKNYIEKKMEEDKVATLQRLLKTQAKKAGKQKTDEEPQVEKPKFIRWICKADLSTLSFPSTQSFLLPGGSKVNYPSMQICEYKGCKNQRKYKNPRNSKGSCSFEHYKQLV
jgi:hypothetical protein